MIIDGKVIAETILKTVATEVATLPTPPRLTVFTCAPNFETKKFLSLKQKRAAEIGVVVHLVTLDRESTTEMVVSAILESVSNTDGIIVQLPFPAHISVEKILAAIPINRDVDVLRYEGEVTDILPPVVGAIDAIALHSDINFGGTSVVIIGQGRLVGKPALLYAEAHGGIVTVVQKNTPDAETIIKNADILILGAGVPGLVTPSMVKPGVVIFDAGTTEESGVLSGDADPAVADVASLFTPVPGGIGPITIAILLRNLVCLTVRQ